MIAELKRMLGIEWKRSPEKATQCACCGNCCELFGGHLNASRPDLERWRRLGREDLLNRVNRLGWIWVDPQTGQREKRCPFLRRLSSDQAVCSIQEIKPDICRAYPTLAHGRRCLRGVFLALALILLETLAVDGPATSLEMIFAI